MLIRLLITITILFTLQVSAQKVFVEEVPLIPMKDFSRWGISCLAAAMEKPDECSHTKSW